MPKTAKKKSAQLQNLAQARVVLEGEGGIGLVGDNTKFSDEAEVLRASIILLEAALKAEKQNSAGLEKDLHAEQAKSEELAKALNAKAEHGTLQEVSS